MFEIRVMLVGWGGNNGSTLTATMLAHKHQVSWKTRRGVQQPNFYGSLLLASTMSIGRDSRTLQPVHVPLKDLFPLLKPASLILGGWDISAANLSEACERAQVLEPDLLRQLEGHLQALKPLPAYYDPKFIALNQFSRANNVISSKLSLRQVLEHLQQDIRSFKKSNGLDAVIVMWTANTERFCEIIPGVHDTAENWFKAIDGNHAEIPPSSLYATAALLENCPFINGSPQNTLLPALVDLSNQRNVPIAGDDFKSGQTKVKSVLVDFLIGAGIKPLSITSYNHLGNNDGANLSETLQFKSKEITKSNVVADVVASNAVLYPENESRPDHTIVIKYVPAVGDSKRALDEYENEIFMGGRNTIAMHNTCEDSLLAVPLMLDLILLTEFLCRVKVSERSHPPSNQVSDGILGPSSFEPLNPVFSLLAYMLKAPLMPISRPQTHSLFRQRLAIENFFRALLDLPFPTELFFEALLKENRK